MVNMIKHYFPFILAVFCTIFAIQIFFHGFAASPYDLYTSLGTIFSDTKQADNSSSIAQKMEAHPKVPLPSIQYVGKTLMTGDPVHFQELFTLTFSDGMVVSPTSITHAALYLDDIKNSKGNSVLTQLTSLEIANLEEVPTAAIYDTEQDLLYFHNSGIYKIILRLFVEGEDGIVFECNIPVEVN